MIGGEITSSVHSLNLFSIGEENQKEFPERVTVFHISLEDLSLREAKFLFFSSINETIEYILVRDVYPYPVESLNADNLEISFRHLIEEGGREIISTYLLFSLPYYKEIAGALEEVLA